MYEKLAFVYDLLMESVDYEGWVTYVEEIANRAGKRIESVLDLACGTGNSTLPWAARGYKVTGIDLSEEMLKKARQKAREKQLEVAFLRGDLRNFQLETNFDLAVCFQDGFNYLLEAAELQQAFRAVFSNLKSGGLFVFDLNFPNRINPEDEEVSFVDEDFLTLIWRTKFSREQKLWEIEVTGFIKKEGGVYEKFRERHREKIYEIHEVWPMLANAGFTVLNTFRSFSFDPPSEQARRVVCVAEKP
ncbi:MAG TPA: class I SAM-dependent methyltransferase [Peptococcaceae bacterium]|nr:class I SAM-dependent methyltransferase [Peptococcaceae bacterium]